MAGGDRYKLSQEEREEEWLEKSMRPSKPNNGGIAKAHEGKGRYLDNPDVKAFNKEIRERVFVRKCAFDNFEDVGLEISNYFDLCDKHSVIPSITSLCLYLGIARDTLYAHANNPNSRYSDILKEAINYCHSILEAGAFEGKVPAVPYIFTAKNFFGMRDDKNITVSPSTDSMSVNSSETMDAIQKQIEAENIPNADFREE